MMSYAQIDDRKCPYTLEFFDNTLEFSFKADHPRKTLSQVRTAIIIAAALYSAFSILDLLVLPEGQLMALLLHFGLAVPVFALGYIATFNNYFENACS